MRRRWLVGGAVIVVATVALLRCEGDAVPAPPPVEAAGPDAERGASTTAERVHDDPRPEREVEADAGAAREAVAEPVLDHPYAFALTLQFVDAYGLPVAGAMAFAAPPHCGASLWPEVADRRGRLAMAWSARVHRMTLTVGAMAWGLLQPMREFDLEAGREKVVTIVVHGRPPDTETLQRARNRTAEQLAEDARKVRVGRRRNRDDLDVLCGRTQFLFSQFDCGNCHDDSTIRQYELLSRCAEAAPSLHPAARFADFGWRPLDGEAARRRAELLQASAAGEAWLPGRNAATGMVSGVVHNAAGEPMPTTPVAWLRPDGGIGARTYTNTRGVFQLAPVPAGPLRMRAGGGALGRDEAELVVTPQFPVDWQARLRGERSVRGTLVDERGGALVGWTTEAETPDRTYAALTTTSNDGSFVLHDAGGLVDLLVWPQGSLQGLPAMTFRTLLPDGEAVTLPLLAPARARLRVRPTLPADCGWATVEVRAVQLDTGRVARLQPLGRDDMYELEGLPAGAYRVEAGAPILGWVPCGAVAVDGRGLWDLGTAALPPPGTLVVEAADEQRSPLRLEHAIYRRLPELDVRVDVRPRAPGRMQLAAGPHLLVWRAAGELHAREFVVTAGGETVLRFD